MLLNNTKLKDLFTRNQTYVEGVKQHMALEFNNVMQKFNDELLKVLYKIKYDNLDALTKKELLLLIRDLRNIQNTIYSVYTESVVKQLKEFTEASSAVSAQIVAYSKDPEGYQKAKDKQGWAIGWLEANALVAGAYTFAQVHDMKRLWATIRNAPIPANGLVMSEFTSAFTASAMAQLESTVNMGWANKWTKEQLINSIVGQITANGNTAVLRKLTNQNNALTSTLVQHVHATVVNMNQALAYNLYIWLSIIDGRTSAICRERNRNIYRHGEGPLPPAHINCRSDTAPYDGGEDEPNEETFYAWMTRQPEKYQNDILGNSIADKLRSGKMKSTDLSKFENRLSLTPAEYLNRIGFIIVTE